MADRMHGAAIAPSGRSGKLGFYACAAEGIGRVVRVARPAGVKGKPPQRVELACPVCGKAHAVNLSWRQPTRLDEGREPEVVLTPHERSSTNVNSTE